MATVDRIKNFTDFYEVYKRQHMKGITRALHVAGTSGFLAAVATSVLLRRPILVPVGVVFAYGLAWVGHFFHERNRPATFRYPLWSLVADFKMLFNILSGREPLSMEANISNSHVKD